MPPAVFEPEIPASKRPQAHALDGKATGTGSYDVYFGPNSRSPKCNFSQNNL
jgi:hypothetical protein